MQTSTVLDNAGILLKTAGLTYADVVSARVFLVDDTYFEAMNDEYRRYFTTEPPARATAITGLMGPDATVEISFIAAENGQEVFFHRSALVGTDWDDVAEGSRLEFGVEAHAEGDRPDERPRAVDVHLAPDQLPAPDHTLLPPQKTGAV